jgi:LuxR family maltose regulon positive regulatory protein
VELYKTKLDPPRDSRELVSRPRLMQKLEDAVQVRLTLLQAPAGYGKTSLLIQWFRALRASRSRVAWVSIDDTDIDSNGLLAYLSAAMSVAGVRIAPMGSTPPDQTLASIVNTLESEKQSLYLFLDGVHCLAPAPLATLCQLIDNAPATVRFILGSRGIPSMPLARARAQGQLLELGVQDLRFTAAEAQQILSSAGDRELTASELAMLQARTEGWITAIQFGGVTLRQGISPADMPTAITGSGCAMADFFAEEVLAALPAEVVDFLLQTSVLERFCPKLCNAVTGRENARTMLDFIDHSGLFVSHLDDERTWYRYHPLFAEFLRRRRLDHCPERDAALHLSASAWFSKHESPIDAIEYALKAEDTQCAADLLEQHCQELTYTGKLQIVCRLAGHLPDEALHRCPRILLCRAWMLTLNLKFEDARASLEVVRNVLQEHAAAADWPAAELRHLGYLLLHREMILAAAEDNAPRVEQQCRHLLEAFPEEKHPYLVGTINAQLLYALREQYQLTDLDRLTATAQGILARSTYSFASIALQANIGPSLFFAGRTDAALRALDNGLSESMRFGERDSPLAALPALPMSEVLYECNELDQAQDLITHSLPNANEFGFVDHLMPGYITAARIKHARGDLAGAQRILDEGMGVAMARKLERLRLAIVAERVKFLLQDGHSEQAVRCGRSAGIPHSCEYLLPKRGVTTGDEWRAVAWFRIALSEGRMQEALSVGKHWRTFCAARGAIRSLIRWDLLLAQALFISTDVRAAQRALREAIAHGAASRAIRSFIDEGAIIRTLLASTYEADLDVLHPTDAFAAELLDTFNAMTKKKPALYAVASRAAPEGLYGKLSAKEREILALVSTGMRNREVATKLGMTEGSVKWYMQQVYDKIGTRRRLQAVERARQFGVIA